MTMKLLGKSSYLVGWLGWLVSWLAWFTVDSKKEKGLPYRV